MNKRGNLHHKGCFCYRKEQILDYFNKAQNALTKATNLMLSYSAIEEINRAKIIIQQQHNRLS